MAQHFYSFTTGDEYYIGGATPGPASEIVSAGEHYSSCPENRQALKLASDADARYRRNGLLIGAACIAVAAVLFGALVWGLMP